MIRSTWKDHQDYEDLCKVKDKLSNAYQLLKRKQEDPEPLTKAPPKLKKQQTSRFNLKDKDKEDEKPAPLESEKKKHPKDEVLTFSLFIMFSPHKASLGHIDYCVEWNGIKGRLQTETFGQHCKQFGGFT